MGCIINSESSAYKYALISVLLWSTVATAFKYSLKYLTPLQLVFYASITSLIILFIVVTYQNKFSLVKEHIKNNYLLILTLGVINPFLYYMVLFKAYDLLPAQEAQAINYTWALMLAFLSVPLLKQKLRLVDIVAGIICYFGVLIISTKGEPFSLNFSNLDGVGLALFSTILWALYWIYSTKVKADSVVSLFSNFLFAIPFITVYMIYTNSFTAIEITGLLGSIYVGLFEMGITFLFWLKAMQSTKNTSKVANLIFLSPFISLIFIYFILNEQIYISTLFGLGAIIFGLFIQSYNKK